MTKEAVVVTIKQNGEETPPSLRDTSPYQWRLKNGYPNIQEYGTQCAFQPLQPLRSSGAPPLSGGGRSGRWHGVPEGLIKAFPVTCKGESE